MRYADGGGLTALGRARREAVRMRAAELFEPDVSTGWVAWRLRVSANSVRVWRRRWRAGGRTALVSKGPGGATCRLDEALLRQLADELDAGPAGHGWVGDQWWTLARVAALLVELFGVWYTLRGVSYLLHRMGWSPQVPVHRAVQRDEAAIAAWRTQPWSSVRARPPRTRRGGVSPTRPGSRCGRRRPAPGAGVDTPRVVGVCGKGSGRVSMAGLIAAKPGERTRLFYRIHTYHGRKTERKGFAEADYATLLRAAHHELHAPLVVVWDGLNTHTSQVMRQFIDAHDWPTIVRLPAYAPQLNPTEGVWSHVKRDLGNLAARGVDPLAATVKTLLKRLQYRPSIIDAFIAETGLTIEPEAP
jgi:transposase